MNDLQSFTKARGYSLRKESTKKHSPPRVGVEVGVMIIGCSKGGKIQAPTSSKRKRPSKMTECHGLRPRGRSALCLYVVYFLSKERINIDNRTDYYTKCPFF